MEVSHLDPFLSDKFRLIESATYLLKRYFTVEGQLTAFGHVQRTAEPKKEHKLNIDEGIIDKLPSSSAFVRAIGPIQTVDPLV